MGKQRIIAIILALLFGVYGVHWFYLNKNDKGAKYLITTLIGVVTSFLIIGFIPILIICVLSIIDLFEFALMSDEKFNEKFNNVTNV